jgi:hypothetical protein
LLQRRALCGAAHAGNQQFKHGKATVGIMTISRGSGQTPEVGQLTVPLRAGRRRCGQTVGNDAIVTIDITNEPY